ncbi:MAG: hypothetical protein PHN98_08055 [Smithellaceae bacterium]|nr:hypothetical protein [Smithellaceae bacterium]
MKKILILFSHPHFEKSRANCALIEDIDEIAVVNGHDMCEEYPDCNISAD